MIVIASAAYVAPELQAEFGRLPPAFLPVGNRRLFMHQADALRRCFPDEVMYLSIPQGFEPSGHDAENLRKQQIQPILVPESLSLAESLLFVINAVADYHSGVRLLHGDTYLGECPKVRNCIAVSTSIDDYAWHYEPAADRQTTIWSGYFSFESTPLLAKCLVSSARQFELAIENYDKQLSLVRSTVDSWLDFGHVNTFYRSRTHFTTERRFNQLRMTPYEVTKTGDNGPKIQAEARWFSTLPSSLRRFVPQLIEVNDACSDNSLSSPSYKLEYLCLSPLNEMYVHGRSGTKQWLHLFQHIQRWFQESAACVQHTSGCPHQLNADLQGLLIDKTWDRLRCFARDQSMDLGHPTRLNGAPLPCLNEIMQTAIQRLDFTDPHPGILHGDLCFSNILFDSRADRIKLIDPRGMSADGRIMQVGDLRYDLAKLAHSVWGLYDFIVAGAFDSDGSAGMDFSLTIHSNPVTVELSARFLDMPMLGDTTARDIAPAVVLLFLGMLPLHADAPQRQRALLANALRLHAELENSP